MRLNLKVENRAKKEHNVSSSVGRPDKLSTFITFLCGAGMSESRAGYDFSLWLYNMKHTAIRISVIPVARFLL